jgi:hypothetical protein
MIRDLAAMREDVRAMRDLLLDYARTTQLERPDDPEGVTPGT